MTVLALLLGLLFCAWCIWAVWPERDPLKGCIVYIWDGTGRIEIGRVKRHDATTLTLDRPIEPPGPRCPECGARLLVSPYYDECAEIDTTGRTVAVVSASEGLRHDCECGYSAKVERDLAP